MTENDSLLTKRLSELSGRAAARGIWTYSEFLTLPQQDDFLRLSIRDVPVSLYGGYPTAERKIAVFGSEDLCGWYEEPPICCVLLKPILQKFADSLTHRDFLGALMSLGIRREVLGDIVVHENRGYLFCLDSISEYIVRELKSVRHTSVTCALSSLPEIVSQPADIMELVVASERLDALVAAVYRLSRSVSQTLFDAEKVFCNGKNVRVSSTCNEGDVISVRGYGRFLYEGFLRETRKGWLRVAVRIY